MKEKICFNKRVGIVALLLVIIISATTLFGILPFYKTSTSSRASAPNVNDELSICVGTQECANMKDGVICKCSEGLSCTPNTKALLNPGILRCRVDPIENIVSKLKTKPGSKGATCESDEDCDVGLKCKYTWADYVFSLGTNANCAPAPIK